MTQTIDLKIQDSTAPHVELLQRMARADIQAFGQLYDLYSRPLYSLVFCMLNDSHAAQDVLQKAFLKIWQKAGSFDTAHGKPFSWLVTIVHNEAIDHIRQRQRQGLIFKEFSDATAQAEMMEISTTAEAFGPDEAARVRKVVNALPVEERRAIELAFFLGLTGQEIAARLGEPLGTVKSRIRRGMSSLRDDLVTTA